MHRGLCSAQHGASTLLDAVNSSVANENDLGLVPLPTAVYIDRPTPTQILIHPHPSRTRKEILTSAGDGPHLTNVFR